MFKKLSIKKRLSQIKFPEPVRLFVFFAILGAFALRLLGSFFDPDMWWHIKLGENILNGSWLNTLTYTCRDYVWVNYSWLSDGLIAYVNNFVGLYGLSIMFAIVFALGLLFNVLTLKEVLKTYKMANTKLNTLLYVLFFVVILSSFVAIRPQVFTFFFLNLLLFILVKFYYSTKFSFKQLVLFLPIFILWVNLHGGFVIGAALIGLFLVDIFFNFLVETFKTNNIPKAKLLLSKCTFLFILLIIFVLCSLVNPFGFDAWKEIVAQLLGSNNASFIMEWRAINIKDSYHLFYFLIFFGALILQAINKTRSSLRLILLVAFGFLSMYSVRYILPASGIVMLVLFVESNILFNTLISGMFKLDKDIQRLLTFLKYLILFFVALVGLMCAFVGINFVISLSDLNNKNNTALESFPVEARQYLQKHEEEFKNLNFYNAYVWGGYLEYNLPKFKWIIDGRMPEWKCGGKVKENIMLDYMEVENTGKSWKDVLLKNNVNALIIRTDGTLASFIKADLSWRLVYTDSNATIFLKK